MFLTLNGLNGFQKDAFNIIWNSILFYAFPSLVKLIPNIFQDTLFYKNH